MSVLVEALSLIVPRKVLDVSYPGGTEAFLNKMNIPPLLCRHACSDDALVSVSFHGTEDATVVGNELLDLGIVAVDDDHFYELAFVDQAKGPTMPCDWIEWQKHEEGYTSCWLAGTDPEPLHTPEGWTPQQSQNLTLHDIRGEPGRCMKLADEPDGHEIWIDFQTGAIASSDPYPLRGEEAVQPPQPPSPKSPIDRRIMHNRRNLSADSATLLASVRAMLDARSYTYHQVDEQSLTLTQRSQHGTYALYVTTNDETDFVGLMATYGSRIPESRRVHVAEALSRINLLLWLGNFELDFSEGELRFRIGIDVEDGLVSETMLSNMLGATLHSMDRYHIALMRIAFGEVEPTVALAEAA
jgi:hypothetical protein